MRKNIILYTVCRKTSGEKWFRLSGHRTPETAAKLKSKLTTLFSRRRAQKGLRSVCNPLWDYETWTVEQWDQYNYNGMLIPAEKMEPLHVNCRCQDEFYAALTGVPKSGRKKK